MIRKGRSYAIEVAKRALEAGALDVAIVEVPANFPHKWDLADRPPEGVTNDDLKFLLECAVPFRTEKEEPITTLPDGFRMTPSGLMGRPAKAAAEADELSWIFIAEPFEVVAEIRDHNSCSWGVLLRWRDGDGRVHEIILQRAALAGDGLEARRMLLDGGLRISPTRRARDLLNGFLLSVRSSGRARFTDRIGWHGDRFVLPNQCFRTCA